MRGIRGNVRPLHRVAILRGIPLRGNWFLGSNGRVELTESLMTHLRDEAYAFLVQQALEAELAGLAREKAAVATRKPKFGVLSGRKSREDFDRSMQTVADSAAALHDRLAQIKGIAEWLRPVVRKDVSSYLASVSPDYCRLLQIHARLDDWGRSYAQLPETLLAFARDLRELRQAVEQEPAASGRGLAVLRESAESLARCHHEFFIIEQAALMQAPAGIAERIRFPRLPELKRLPWVGRIAVLAAPQLIAEVARVETEFREFLAGPGKTVSAQLQASGAVCLQLANQALDDYWTVLREHARKHYVEECGVDDVIATLTERYIHTDLQRRQEALTVAPFTWR